VLMKLFAEMGMPLPKMWLLSGFPAPNIPEADRPWSKNGPMADPAFKEECRGWDVNEIIFQESNWKAFNGMMRDDFTLFDSYTYTPPPAHIAKGEFPVPIKTYCLDKDQRCKRNHLEMWKAFTTEKLTFETTEMGGNHLFFYDVPARAKWMESIISKLPPAFKPTSQVDLK